MLRSPLLESIQGVVHAFTERDGGVSQGPYASLNLGLRCDDMRTHVEENRRRVLESLGRLDARLVSVNQMHAAVVVEVNQQASRSIEADALLTRDRRAVLSVLVADCVPILIADTQGRAVAAVHAGWRGTRLKVAALAVERLSKFGIAAAQLRVALGPAIGPCCFQIGDDVATELDKAFPGGVQRRSDGTSVADLWQLNRRALEEVGIAAEHIDAFQLCSKCDARFFSHRRDGGVTGRQAGVIGFAAP